MKITLAPDQWAAFGRDDDRHHDSERSALQSCCGNIAALRDVILRLAEHDGEFVITSRDELAQKWEWCRRGHAFDEVRHPVLNTLKSLITQAGLPWRQ